MLGKDETRLGLAKPDPPLSRRRFLFIFSVASLPMWAVGKAGQPLANGVLPNAFVATASQFLMFDFVYSNKFFYNKLIDFLGWLQKKGIQNESVGVGVLNWGQYIGPLSKLLPIMYRPLPQPQRYGGYALLNEDLENGVLAGYRIGDGWVPGLSTQSFKRKDMDWDVRGLRLFSIDSVISGIVVFYNDSKEEDYLYYAWETLKNKLGKATRIEYKAVAIEVWTTDRFVIGMGFYDEPKYFLFVFDKVQLKNSAIKSGGSSTGTKVSPKDSRSR